MSPYVNQVDPMSGIDRVVDLNVESHLEPTLQRNNRGRRGFSDGLSFAIEWFVDVPMTRFHLDLVAR